jgi:hypothetical protein
LHALVVDLDYIDAVIRIVDLGAVIGPAKRHAIALKLQRGDGSAECSLYVPVAICYHDGWSDALGSQGRLRLFDMVKRE